MTLVSRLLSQERESHSFLPSKAHTLECQDCGSSYRTENLRCIRPLDYLDMFFTSRN